MKNDLLELQDPVLQQLPPDTEPSSSEDDLDDFGELKIASNDSSTVAMIRSTIGEYTSVTSSVKKLLDVKHQVVEDALGNSGVYTGQLDVESNRPHGTGEMQYSLLDNDDKNSSSNTGISPTLVASYKGSWEKGYWQGHGTQTLNNGDSFVGDFDQSKRTFGEYRWNEQSSPSTNNGPIVRKQRTYHGEFLENGCPHGHGKYTWTTITTTTTTANGGETSETSTKAVSTYIGMFDNGQRNGHGVFTSSRLQYTGDWLGGKYHGYGVLKIFSKNTTFKGQFHHGIRDGQGEEILEDGTVVHRGLWRQDRPVKAEGLPVHLEDDESSDLDEETTPIHQQPTGPISTLYQTPQQIKDGEGFVGMYKGIVEDELPSGVGTIAYEKHHHPTGITRYEGFFDKGIRQGYGRADFATGDTYHGNWSGGVFEGHGEYMFADGRMYKGSWTQGLPNDKKAKFTWPNNDAFEGVYDNGHRKSGRIVFASGAYYDGEFYSPDGLYGGCGKLVTLMVSYEGEFRDGMFHGKGCLKKNSGFVIYDGTWKDGKALREDVMIAIPEDLLDVPLPPPDDDFGAFDDTPDTSDCLPTPKSTTLPTHHGHDEPWPTLSATIMETSSKLFGSLAASFSPVFEDPSKESKPHNDDCKAVVDMPISDAQDNPGRYTGIIHMESQRPHGVGRMVYKDGNRIHEGFWSHGHREGHGRCIFTKVGDFHEGEYKQNLRHGPGKYFWKDGRRFVGNYHLDERSGKGTFIYPNGDTYTGNFESGTRSGFGEFIFCNRTCSYRGEWKKSSYEGSGRLRWTTQKGTHVYEGEFESGMFHGNGTEYLNDTVLRQGWWSTGTYQGEKDPNDPVVRIQCVGDDKMDVVPTDASYESFHPQMNALHLSNRTIPITEFNGKILSNRPMSDKDM
ncbi:MORN repeat-containing protein [Nitzschia inconspicua]|uniref:MORN repeat-containing protein n=1 Tax=Nitzschia inconspicua TaxID=303405 RepID=A0A9K3L7Y9_9STRA|nr:MORN repeat-containing protein [Nitzschia inconspicua]